MKIAFASSVFAFVLPLVSLAAQPESPVKVTAQYSAGYMPAGFDDNDHIQIVAEGTLRNFCYRPAETSVTVDTARKKIVLEAAAYQYSGFCLQVALPFERVIDIGILPAGQYEVEQRDGSKLGILPVRQARTASADDFNYAPISQAFFRNTGLQSEIYITGHFLNSCMAVSEVKVAVEQNVIVVQPIATLEDRRDCVGGKFHFEKLERVDLIPSGRYLLHVRSLNSKSVNSLVDVK